MYDLTAYHFVSIDEYTNTELKCTIENEDNGKLLTFHVGHDNIIDYYADLGVDLPRITRSIIDSDDIEDICSNLYIDLQKAEDTIMGLYVTSPKKPFWEFVIDQVNSSLIPRNGNESEDFLIAYKNKVGATHFKPVFL